MIIELTRISEECITKMYEHQKMVISEEEQQEFESSMTCHICKNAFSNKDRKVRDHCHRTGKYRGPAHVNATSFIGMICFLPVVIHKVREYASHLIIKLSYDIKNELGNKKY